MRRTVYKTLSKNDLGLTGSHQAGVLVPKELARDGFFPYLNPELTNPRVKIRFNYSGCTEELTLIYYNSRPLGTGTRDEYRITGLSKFYREYSCEPGDRLRFIFDDEKNEYELTVEKEEKVYDEDWLSKPLVIKAGWAY